MIHGDTLSRLLGGSSLADCKVKTEPAETGKVLSLLLYFSTRTFNFFFPIWKCSWGAGKGRLANSRGLREEKLCPCRAVSLIESGSSPGRPAPKPARLPGPPPRRNIPAASLVFTALRCRQCAAPPRYTSNVPCAPAAPASWP